ncbi:GntR family transcriptional regulator [Nocardia alni]|uniref:GntR family transcriptional regulator n=1 Tax=Nocardia alni TaxID=2815723 RepID=UPI001C23A394|nr:GntR family transcriptional regulator [Nocardia alni]
MSRDPKDTLVPRASLADAVYERLRDDIVRGVLSNGSNLNQVHLAERYGVSRIPVREALRRLQAESLVKAAPYHQFVVSRPTVDQILELVDIRIALEDHALVKRGVVPSDTIDQLRALNEQMKGERGEEFMELDRRLHQLIAGPGTMVSEVIIDVRTRIHTHLASMVTNEPGRSTATAEHERLIAALSAGDLERAREVMREHVMTSRNFILYRIDKSAAEQGRRPAEEQRG